MGADDQSIVRRPKARSGPVEDHEDSEFDPEGPSAADIEQFSDVTVKCQGCGTELMDDGAECWKCGRVVGGRGTHESGLPAWAVVTVVLAVVLIGGWLVRGVF